VFVYISHLVGKGVHIAGETQSDPPNQPAEAAAATSKKISPPPAAAPVATADDKLARLLNQKKD
jgi:hypothetical protein